MNPVAGDPLTGRGAVNLVELQIAGTEMAAQELGTTTHEVKPGDALKEIRVDFTKDGKSIFESFPAANREAARQGGQAMVIEDATQLGFLVESEVGTGALAGIKNTFNNVTYYKADNDRWNITTDDLLDLSYMKIQVEDNVAADARPGNYNLSFVVKENNNGTVLENELIKVTVPVAITVPTFDKLFTQDANWNDTKDTYEARIIIDDNKPTLRYSNAFGKTGDYDVETSHITISFDALDSYNTYPIDITVGVQETVTDNRRVVITPISNDVTLDKENVYNSDKTALKVDKLEGMYAYYDTFDGLTDIDLNNAVGFDADAVRQAFTITSGAFTTQIREALYGIKAAYYNNNAVVNNVVLNADNTITKGSGAGTDASKFNGFVFTLNNDYLHVSAANFDETTGYDKLDGFTLYKASSLTSRIGNEVNVLFEDANGATSLSWLYDSTSPNDLSLQIPLTVDASTLKITFKDATGIEYKQEVKIQKPAN